MFWKLYWNAKKKRDQEECWKAIANSRHEESAVHREGQSVGQVIPTWDFEILYMYGSNLSSLQRLGGRPLNRNGSVTTAIHIKTNPSACCVRWNAAFHGTSRCSISCLAAVLGNTISLCLKIFYKVTVLGKVLGPRALKDSRSPQLWSLEESEVIYFLHGRSRWKLPWNYIMETAMEAVNCVSMKVDSSFRSWSDLGRSRGSHHC